MANLEQLKQKYQPALSAIQAEGGQVQSLNLEGEQRVLNATVPTENSKIVSGTPSSLSIPRLPT